MTLACNACKEVYSNNDFIEVLQYILAIGNYINAGTKKGNSYGFKLSTLTKVNVILFVCLSVVFKLLEFRAAESKQTLLHYLVQQIHDNNIELLGFHESMDSVVKAGDTESNQIFIHTFIHLLS